ncbi:MAG: hypothetical protein PHP25_05370, partial [Candidatus Moranbacteria bacterium]|nr:hypothetical protein [Candidatus Moranbacteria bacterium]
MEDVKINNAGESAGKLEHMERFFKHETGTTEPASESKTPGRAEIHAGETSVMQYEPKALKKIMRFFVFGVFILIVGGIGGIVADRWFIPFVVSQPGFSQFAWLQRIKENTVIVKTTEEIKISEDLAMVDAIAKTKSAIATVVVSYNLEQKPVARSKKPLAAETYFEKISGAVITGDGLVLARPSGFIPPERLKDKILKSVGYKVILADKREFIVTDPNNIHQYALKSLAENPIA